MTWRARIFVAVLLLQVVYVAWPLLGFKRIADAVEARDATQFVKLLDIRELKRSLAVQIAEAHLKLITGRRLSPLARNLAMQAGIAAADSYVVEILQTESLFDLLKPSSIETLGGPLVKPQAWAVPNLRNAAKLLASELKGRNFYVIVPLSADAQHGYRLRLKLSQWRWKLAGIDLPEHVQLRLVQEFMNRGSTAP
jgi:hypothetical protein